MLTCCTAEGRKISFAISQFFIKIDSSNSFYMTITYKENFTNILWYIGIVTIARYCDCCDIFNIIFSDRDIWSSFSFKMTYEFDWGGTFFELFDAIFVELHFAISYVFFVSNRVNLLLVSKYISIDPLCLLLLLLEEWAICQLELFMLKSYFLLCLSTTGVFSEFLSLLPDKFSIILS